MHTAIPAPTVGHLLRDWRQRRRLSQLDLALEAEVSARHLSFMENGRSTPSREMLLRLSEHLDVPLRERNALLVAAGYAPIYAERPLAHPAMDAARRALELVLKGHEPYPAIAVDRHWQLVSANGAAQAWLVGIEPDMLTPPVNVLRLSLHPRGFAPRLVNLLQWRSHLLARLHQQVEASGDPVLAALADELREYPVSYPGQEPGGEEHDDLGGVAIPLRLRMPDGSVLSFISTITVFGTPVDITLSEIALETFFPADEATAKYLGG